MSNENVNPIFKPILDQLSGPEEITHVVPRWKHTDKYPCPKCGKKLSGPAYTCTDCNVKLNVKVKMFF